MGSTVYKWYLLWAIWSLRDRGRFRAMQTVGPTALLASPAWNHCPMSRQNLARDMFHYLAVVGGTRDFTAGDDFVARVCDATNIRLLRSRSHCGHALV